MVPDTAPLLADPGWNPRWKRRWFAWRARTRVGVTTASSARCPTWAIRSQIKPSATSCGATTSHRRPSEVKRPLGRISSAGIWMCSLERISSVETETSAPALDSHDYSAKWSRTRSIHRSGDLGERASKVE
jgi:hypothetical protein